MSISTSQPDLEGDESAPTLSQLGKQLVPLSFSDAAMALADPLLAITLTRLPNPEANLAALGVVKAIAVFLESPIIMVLHASTALSGWLPSRRAFGRFVGGLSVLLTAILLVLSVPQVYSWLMGDIYSLSDPVSQAARWPLLIMCLWPALIAWRRFHQGHLILQGRGKHMGFASMFRVVGFAAILGLGGWFGTPGAALGAAAFMLALAIEAFLVTVWSRSVELPSTPPVNPLPDDIPGVARYYAPLALTMLLMWGGRAALVAVLARAEDKALALAAWAASWGFVILIANLTRMVQQLVIKYAHKVPPSRLAALGALAGLISTVMVVGLGHTSVGNSLIQILIGEDPAVGAAGQAVVALSVGVPMLVALQNVLQGYCIVAGRNVWINGAGLLGVAVTLGAAIYGIQQNAPGANVGAIAVTTGLLVEVGLLLLLRPWKLALLSD